MGLPSLPGLPGLPQLLPRIEAALTAVIELERTLRTLPEDIRLLQLELASVGAIHGELHGMRGDIRDVIAAVVMLHEQIGRLPPDVVHLRGTVDGMFAAVSGLDGQVASMGESLERIERMATRVAHPLRPRRPATPPRPEPEDV